MDFEDNWSPAVKYLVALFLASRNLGDRQRCALMYQGLHIAIENRFTFGIDDASILKQECVALSTCVGSFSPIWDRGYERAVRFESSYIGMYEYAVNMRPWKHPEVLIPKNILKLIDVERRANCRVVPGFAIERRATIEDRFYCTSISDDRIILCRYHLLEPEKRCLHNSMIWSDRVANRLMMNRAQWEVFCKNWESENT